MPSVPIRAPELTLIAPVPTSAGRVLELLIRPAPGTYSIRIRAVDVPVLSAEVDGHSIDGGRYRTRSSQWTLSYVAPPDNGFTLKLTVPRDSPVGFDLIARSLGLPEGIVIPCVHPVLFPFRQVTLQSSIGASISRRWAHLFQACSPCDCRPVVGMQAQ